MLLKAELITFLMAMVPVVELRGAIPYGVLAGLSVHTAFILAVLGNLAPIPFLVVFTRKVFEWLRTKSVWLDDLVKKLEAKADNKKGIVEKYEFFGLMLLVAIPLPGTGAWTGARRNAGYETQKGNAGNNSRSSGRWSHSNNSHIWSGRIIQLM